MTFLLVLCAHARCGRSPIGLVVVTAADRAAATFAAWEQALYKKKALTFCQSLLLIYARTKRLPPQRELSAASLTEDNPHLARPRRLYQPPWTQPTRKEPRPRSGGTKPEATYPTERQPLFGSGGLGERRFSQRSGLSPRVSPTPTPHVRGGSVSRRGLNQLAKNRAHAQAEPSQKQRTPPNASRSSGVGGWGRGASLREAASPPESPPPLTSHVRGGSVSRRGLNQLARNRAHAQAEPSQKQRTPPNASRSSGVGVWGRGASLREAASPPESPQPPVSSGGGPGEGLLYREAASPGVPHSLPVCTSMSLWLRLPR